MESTGKAAVSATRNRHGVFRTLSLFLLVSEATLTLSAFSASSPEVLSFSPEGTVKDVRQVRATFSEPMVAFGDPKAGGDPFDISCAAAGHGRWADAKNWIYDLEKDLPGGVRCVFKIKPGLKAFAGTPLSGRTEFGFDTGGPSIKRSEPWEGSSVDEEQVFILSLDAEADPATVLAHAYFSVAGIQEKIPVRILEQDPRKAAASPQGLGAKVRLWAHKFGRPTRVGTRRAGVAETVIQARRRFPPGAKVTLVWGAGIATPSGAALRTDQSMPFEVRPEFSAEFNCERENAQAACIPISPMTLNFNAEVPWSEARKIRLRAKSGEERKPQTSGKKPEQDDDPVSQITFPGTFPERTQFEIILPSGLRDDAGRPLANAGRFPLAVATADFPPLIKFPSEFGILEFSESQPEAVLPVTVRNVEATLKAGLGRITEGGESGETIEGRVLRIGTGKFSKTIDWLAKVGRAEREHSVFGSRGENATETLSVPKPAGDKAFEVIGIPLKKPGFYVVEFESRRLGAALLGKPAPMYVPTAALVTNLSVHFKLGRESSLAWVTSLDHAKPVEGAIVTVRDCAGTLLASATTGSKGIALLQKELHARGEARCSRKHGYSQYSDGLFITAEKGEDFSFVHSSWQKGIESWRFNLPSAYVLTPEYASTVFDRTLFRAGETVRMKHFFRKHSGRGIEAPAAEHLPKLLRLTHQESDQSYELPVHWRGDAVAESSWAIPKNAKLGVYTATLLNSAGKRHGGGGWQSGEIRVEEYRVPLMKGQIKPPSIDLILPKEVAFDFSVEYLAGGAAARLPVQVRHQTSIAEPVEFPEFDGYVFGTGKARDPGGEEAPLGPGEVELDLDAPTPETTAGAQGASPAAKLALTLDQGGTGHLALPVGAKHQDQLKRLHVELDYRDPNGETQTVSRSVPLYPSARLIGVKPNSWFATKKSLKFQVAVTDLHGKGVSHAPVNVELVEQKTYSHRKRLVGGFYSYDNRAELKRHGKACSGTTDEKGLLDCETVPPVSGNLILEARTADEAGHAAYSTSSTWVYDSEEWWFAQEDSDRIDLLPERKQYQAGEKAVFQVRMPFREATALVTVEREGILDSFVVPLSGKKPLIEVPILPNYSPNVFISALVVRGRVGDVQPTALVDLGRPAYKLGISEIQVGWKPHELQVRVKPSSDVYQVREKGRFKIQVRTASGVPLPKGSEVALAAVDEGLLQLKPNESWKLLEAMMHRRGYEVQTMTAQSEVIGKRHFGVKALPTGGDGGKAPAREIFDSLLYWNGALRLNAEGEAEIEFPMNDSITGFRIAAVANAGTDLFGTGYASIRTTQDLMILSGIPPLAREGDSLALEFTLRNTTPKPMALAITGQAPGLPDFSPPETPLAPNESHLVRWNVTVPKDVAKLDYTLSARDRLGKAADRILIHEKVIPSVPVRIFQATLQQLDGKYTMPVEIPRDALPGRGGLRLQLEPTLLTGLDGVREYMGGYPYTCLEQRVSKAVALRDKKLWKGIVDDLPNYLDHDGLAKYFPADWLAGSDILTSYVVALSQEAGWDFPTALREKMVNGLKAFAEGRITRISDLPTADLTVRKVSALEAISRYGAATWAMTGSLQPSPELWPTSAVIDWMEMLKRLKSPEAEARRRQADQILRSRLNFQGTMMGFSTENVDQLWWMMVSTSVNANRFLLSSAEDPLWKDDIGRVVRGALNRQRQGHWDTTTANAWGVLAVEKFARLFEKSAVTGSTLALLPESPEPHEFKLDWSASPAGQSHDFGWPAGPGTLAVTHTGDGRPWVTLQSRAAIPLKEPLSTGYRVSKTWTPVEQKSPGKWTRGDIARVKLELESQSDMTWVVVNDPIPAGSSILGSGLGNDSAVATTGEKQRGWAEPAFQERAFDGYRAYYQFVPKGKWTAEYTVRFNQAGKMGLPPTRVEAMYAPEMFGELPNQDLTVAE